MNEFDLIVQGLLGETLAQLNLANKSGAHLSKTVEAAAVRFDEQSDLAVMKFINQSEIASKIIKEGSQELEAMAKEVRAARNTILGEIAIRQHDEAHKMHTDILRKILKDHLPQTAPSWKNQIILVVSSSVVTALMCLVLFTFFRG